MARSGFALPDPFAVVQYAAIGGIAYFVLKPGVDGVSIFQKLTQGIVSSLPGHTGGVGGPTPAGGQAGSDNRWGPANGGDNTFNINTGQSSVAPVLGLPFAVAGLPSLSAHVGFGHIGAGGQFNVILMDAQGNQVAQQTVFVGQDGQWNGYGADFMFAPPQNWGAFQNHIWAAIVGTSGEQYTTAQIV